MPNYVKPGDLVDNVIAAGKVKSELKLLDLIIRGLYAGILLGFATTLAFTATTQTVAIVGALIFPVGFILIILFGFELCTGNFAVIPISFFAKQATLKGLLVNWAVVWISNFCGSLLYMGLFLAVTTSVGDDPDGNNTVSALIITVGQAKTTRYGILGVNGWFECFFRAILCNWMVCLGTLCNFISTSTTGKIAAAWLPILIFFAQGYEHAVVNMFLIPCAMAYGAPIDWGDFWGYNIIPVTLGNIVAGVLLVAVPYWLTWGAQFRAAQKKKMEEALASSIEAGPVNGDTYPVVYEYGYKDAPLTGYYPVYDPVPSYTPMPPYQTPVAPYAFY